MFDATWKNTEKYSLESRVPASVTRLPVERVQSVALLHWEEHCLECAPPDCYRSCHRYKPRVDCKCLRMSYGFAENTDFSGLFTFGIDCRFEPWAKIECKFNPFGCAPVDIRRICEKSSLFSEKMLSFSRALKFISPKLKPTGALNKYREKYFLARGKGKEPEFDAFVLECYSPETEPFRLQLQCDCNEILLFRRAFDINPGMNYYEVPAVRFNISPGTPNPRIFIYPENDRCCRLVFTWLDFVRFKPGRGRQDVPAEKVKCMAWDLDNTLWKGVLIEDGPGGVKLNHEAVKAIRLLDGRGILNTIVSKNDHGQAMALLERLGLADYFLYPAINWGAKSENLKKVASRLNLGLDSFALVDDSQHERQEVSLRLPMVRVYTDEQISTLDELPEMDVPVTETGGRRRMTYLSSMRREEVQASFGENYEDFLRSLEMRMEIFRPASDGEKARCLELLHRSNQLNLSTYRYPDEEFHNMLESSGALCLAFSCSDKFGDYGIAGFISVALGEAVPRIKDLVISCRIAQKRFEYALMYRICRKLKDKGYRELAARLVKTKRNGPLVEIFKNLPFEAVLEDKENIHYRLSDLDMAKDENIISTDFRHPE